MDNQIVDQELTAEEAAQLAAGIIQGCEIFSVSHNRAWPQSLYFGRYPGCKLVLRVSDHTKPYAPRQIEIDVLVRNGITEAEVRDKTEKAILEFEREENQEFFDDMGYWPWESPADRRRQDDDDE